MQIKYVPNINNHYFTLNRHRHRDGYYYYYCYYYYYYFACKSVVFKSTLVTYKYSNRLSEGKNVFGISTSWLFERSLYMYEYWIIFLITTFELFAKINK